MTWFDYTLMILIGAGALWIIFRSLYKEGKVQCPSCDAQGCPVKSIPPKL